jgi:ATP-dependent Clp protease ATP-binding subunit ClpX
VEENYLIKVIYIMDQTDIKCTLCCKSRKEVEIMIEGPVISDESMYICNECIDLLHSAVHEKENTQFSKSKSMSPSDIKARLDEYIIGQDSAKRSISIAIYNHHKRVNDIGCSNTKIQKSNIMVIGPSGTGKTLMAETTAKVMDLPFAIGDATALTEAGYAGNDVENLIKRLIQSANGDIEKAEKGVIFIDEIDKKRKKESSSNSKDISGEGVQQALLKLVEGTVVKVPMDSSTSVEVNTENILFICGGAFVGLSDIVKKNRQGKSTIGFGAKLADSVNDCNLYTQATSEDIIDYGMLTELVGRFPVLITLEQLTEKNMEEILIEPKNSIIDQYKRLFEIDGVGLLFDDKYIKQVAHLGFKQKTGARGLRAIIEKDLQWVQYGLPDLAKEGVKYVYVLDGGTVKTTKRKLKKQTTQRKVNVSI